MEILGTGTDLSVFDARERIINRHFDSTFPSHLEAVYLPEAMAALMNESPTRTMRFIEDDNRGAVSPDPVARLDGTEFHLSVKGIGSTTDPFSFRMLDRAYVSTLVEDNSLRSRLMQSGAGGNRFITGELWLRGSPYGGQGLEHAMAALRISEMADLTSIDGFRIAPVIGIVFLPKSLENDIRDIFWYRRFGGRIVQELRLVPSNIRVYFHSSSVVGRNIARIFDMFRVDSDEKALAFEMNFIRSCISMLTLFPRTMGRRDDGRYTGLDFNDVWLDKDAVIAPDGTAYFVDLEGIEEIGVDGDMVTDKIEEQLHRSLYEFMFAYEQIEHERAARFGKSLDRRTRFEMLVSEALRDDPFIDTSKEGGSLKLTIKNKLSEERLYKSFSIVDKGIA